MVREAALLVSTGTFVYVWLCAAGAPLLSALTTIGRDPGHGRTWRAAALALATASLWTVVAAGMVALLVITAPHLVLAIVESPLRVAGPVAGSAVWIVRSAWLGTPRLSVDAEIASALAVVALVRDDLETLRAVEALYRERVLWLPSVTDGRRVSSAAA